MSNSQPESRAALLVRQVQAIRNHPAVMAAGLRPTLVELCEYLAETEARLAVLESLLARERASLAAARSIPTGDGHGR